jgi:hypothetical protein
MIIAEEQKDVFIRFLERQKTLWVFRIQLVLHSSNSLNAELKPFVRPMAGNEPKEFSLSHSFTKQSISGVVQNKANQ